MVLRGIYESLKLNVKFYVNVNFSETNIHSFHQILKYFTLKY